MKHAHDHCHHEQHGHHAHAAHNHGHAHEHATAVQPEKNVAAAAPATAAATIWTCPMHPEIRRDAPGACPICGMALEPKVASLDDAPSADGLLKAADTSLYAAKAAGRNQVGAATGRADRGAPR